MTRTPGCVGVAHGPGRRPPREPPARRSAWCRVAALAAAARTGRDAAGPGALRVGPHADPCGLPHHGHRFAAVRDGGRRVGRDRGGRPRGAGRHFAVHGRRIHDRSQPVLHLLLRYTQALITQMAQTAVCNRYHTLDQQLCRWLLLSLDRLGSNELSMTQELIANMLGVRREGVTEAAGNLQDAGLIHYRRGNITVHDPPGLEARVCKCYRVVKTEFDRLLPYA